MIFYEAIFRAFQKQEVKYVLVGGIAFNLPGAMRNTADLDILVEMSDHNLKNGFWRSWETRLQAGML